MKLINKEYLLILTLIYSFLASFQAVAQTPDWTEYNQLLMQHVSSGTLNGVDLMRVNYAAIQNDNRYTKTLKMISSFNTAKLETKNERLAFYINAYNILAIKMVLDHWPVKSIKDIGSIFSSVWKKDVGILNGQMTTLDKIEHEILRKMGEPRIHMAIVCASVSCPDLRNEAYTAKNLIVQLNGQSRLFLNNPKKGLYVKGNTIYVSKIFDWFEKDFEHLGGVKAFIGQYRKDLPKNASLEADLNYDWQLNKK